MERIKVHDLLPQRALITRDSARLIQGALTDALVRGRGEATLDFTGVQAVTPSFVDEVLSVVDEVLGRIESDRVRVVFLNPPTRLSEKFAAVSRRHGLSASEAGSDTWMIVKEDRAQP
jgi:hypothetical protein